jgi:hypothetical protein
MTVYRITASTDNTITNAYGENLTTRGTGSNMGASDILEVFSIYGQASSTSTEYARTLVQFPLDTISTKRTAGTLPASGSVDWYLKLYNAKHVDSVPKDFKFFVLPVSSSWEEGVGLDMEDYSDVTYDSTGSNWINADSTFTSASATITALSKTAGQANTRTLIIPDSAGNTVSFQIDNTLSTSTATKIAFANANSNATQFATNIKAAVNLAEAASTLNVTAESDGATITLKQTAEGHAGDSAGSITGTAVSDSVLTIVSHFGEGSGKWATVGGDYLFNEAVTASFSTGLEDLEIDVSDIVEDWVKGTAGSEYSNYGFGIILDPAQASHAKSYYTKKFFGRGTEFYFKQPVLEARWDDSKKDDRGDFYMSSSLAPAADNLNTLYLYNYIKGKLTNIPSIGEDTIRLSIFSGSSDNSEPTGSPLDMVIDGANVITGYSKVVTGSYVSKGIYKATFAFTGSSTMTNIFDVWFSGSNSLVSAPGALHFHTGAVSLKSFTAAVEDSDSKYVVSILNNNHEYHKEQTARFKLYTRLKNWSPNLYTVAQTTPENLIIEDALYKIFRVSDDTTIIDYSSGSVKHTQLSYNVSGNYFDLDMSMLEPRYQYGIKFSFYNSYLSSYVEQPYIFKFRVVD